MARGRERDLLSLKLVKAGQLDSPHPQAPTPLPVRQTHTVCIRRILQGGGRWIQTPLPVRYALRIYGVY